MEKNANIPFYEYVIIGGGLSGAISFSEFSKIGKTILIEKHPAPIDPKKHFQAKVICKHSFPWMIDSPWEDKSIFLRDHLKALYRSKDNDGLIDGNEFDTILGKIVNLPALTKWYCDLGKSNNGEILYGKEVIKIDNSTTRNNCELRLSDTSKIQSNLVIIASGATGFSLHKEVKIPSPEKFNSLSMTFHADERILDENLPCDYMFHLHPKISQVGMLWMTRGNDFFNIGLISNESEIEMREKFTRILKNYKMIKPFFQNVTPNVEDLLDSSYYYQQTTKFPISTFHSNRVLVVGNAGGLLYPLYLEGILGAFVSARLARDIIGVLNEKHLGYSESALKSYTDKLNNTLVHPYLEAGIRGNTLFFHANDKPIFTVWDAYIQVIQNNRKVRKNIVTAFTCADICNYPVENDSWCGERIYQQLPLGKRIALTPVFLKQKINQK